MVECSLNMPRNNLQDEHHVLLFVLFESCFHAYGDFEGLAGPILAQYDASFCRHQQRQAFREATLLALRMSVIVFPFRDICW
jgi:hypothetical protein